MGLEPDIELGRILELTELDRSILAAQAEQLTWALENRKGSPAMLILDMFKLVQAAIARSHAS